MHTDTHRYTQTEIAYIDIHTHIQIDIQTYESVQDKVE